jgi:hypothetical protein
LTPQGDRQLSHPAITHFDAKPIPHLVTQMRSRHVGIPLQFSHNPQRNFSRDLGSSSSFASIHQNYPMASTLNVPTPQSRDVLGVIRQSQVLTHRFQRFALLDPLDQLFLAQGEIDLSLRESLIHRLSSWLDNRQCT